MNNQKNDPNTTTTALVLPTIKRTEIEMANKWDGQEVIIFGRGGRICVIEETGQIVTGYQGGSGDTTRGKTIIDQFIVRKCGNVPGTVCFQISGEDDIIDHQEEHHTSSCNSKKNRPKYLTMPLYGNMEREKIIDALSSSTPEWLDMDTIPLIVDYIVGQETDKDNFEGEGFYYSPMTATTTCHHGDYRLTQQLFIFKKIPTSRRVNDERYGIQALNGAYWRSQRGDKIISQSPYLHDDGEWTFQLVTDEVSCHSDVDSETDW